MNGNNRPIAEPIGEVSTAPALREQHDHIRRFATGLVTMTLGPAPADSEEFGRLRVAISRALRDHFNAEDQAMGRAMWSQTGMPAQLLADWDSQRQEFRQSYSQHLRDWPLADALRDWRGYGKAVADCIKAGEALARLEETHIYPLVSSQRASGSA